MKRLHQQLVALACTLLAGACGGSTDGNSSAGGDSAPTKVPEPPALDGLDERLSKDGADEVRAATAAVTKAPRSDAAWAKLGEAYEVHQLSEQAVQAFQVALDLAPANPRHAYRAAINTQRGMDLEGALSRIDRCLELDGSYGPAWRRKGLWHLDLGQVEEARSAFEKVIELLPQVPDGWIGLAKTELAADDPELAEAHARKALAMNQGAAYAKLLVGEALRRQGKTEEAKPLLDAGSGAIPGFVDPWSEAIEQRRNVDQRLVREGRKLEDQGRFDDALAKYDDVLERRPEDPNVLLRKGVTLLRAGRSREAARFFNSAIRIAPGNYDLMTSRVGALRAAGSAREAIEAADSLISQWPNRAQAYLLKGELLRDQKDYEAAGAAFRNVTRIDPKDLRGRMIEARMRVEAGQGAMALSILQSGVDLDAPGLPLSYFRMLLVAQNASGIDRSTIISTYERAVELHGDEAKKLLRRR